MRLVVDIATIASGAAAAFGLIFTALQVRRSRISTDFQALQEFYNAMAACERELARAASTQVYSERRHAFVELMNTLEVYATAYNRGLFGRATRGLVRDKIAESVVVLERSTLWHQEIEKAITSETTFSELTLFARQQHATLEKHRILAHAKASTSVE